MKEFQTVLFLCTGNFYRSRYAEAWFNYQAPGHSLLWRAESRGFRPHLATEDLSHFASDRLDHAGIPRTLTRQLPTRLSRDDLAEASLVIALKKSEHEPMVREQFPEWTERIHYWDVSDIDEIRPEVALPMIEAEVEQLVGNLSRGHALGKRRDVFVEF